MSDTSIEDVGLAITASALSGDAGAVYRIVGDLLDEGVPFEKVLFELLMPSEGQVGARWQQGDYLVAEEHVITAVIETVVSLLAGSLSRPEGGLEVVVATAEGDHHSLPARAVAAHLLYLGHPTTFLGANAPAQDLAEYLEIERPAALVLSSAMVQNIFGVRAAIRGSHLLGVPVIVGGAGFGPAGRWARTVGADAWVASPREVAHTLEVWSPDPEAAESSAVDPSPELRAFYDRRPSIASRAMDRLWSNENTTPDSRLQSEMELLVGAVLASALVDSLEPLAETLGWQAVTLAAQGYQPIPDLSGELATVLAEMDPGLHQRLVAATQ